jgi:hypothetical protein
MRAAFLIYDNYFVSIPRDWLDLVGDARRGDSTVSAAPH